MGDLDPGTCFPFELGMVYPHSYQHTQEANTLAGLQRAQRSNCPELVGYRV